MENLSLKPERLAQLEDFAREHGQSVGDALDDAVATFLDWQREDFQQAVEGIRRGYDDLKAGRTRPAGEFFAQALRERAAQ